MKLIDKYTKEQFLELFKKLRSNNEVARFLKISTPSVKRLKKEFGITSNDYEYFHKGKPAWNSGKGYRSFCEICNKEIIAPKKKKRRFCSRECNHIWFKKEYTGEKFKGSKNPNFGNGEVLKKRYANGSIKKKPFTGKQFTKGKVTKYKGINFRSSWEAEFARELDETDIEWLYENKRFRLSDGRHYTPDFYVPSENLFYEVKGYWWPSAKEKFDKFLIEYPEIKIEVKGQEWWKERQKKLMNI